MSFGFYYPIKSAPTAQWVPVTQPEYPAGEVLDYPEQINSVTAGGTLYVQDKGVKRETFQFNFGRMSQSDRDSAKTFFDTVKKSFNTFEFEDRNASLHTVRWMNGFNFQLVLFGKYSGSIDLRKEAI
ncbi:MAG: hypothetical protein H8E42_13445 [Nitrospinae bacterium]|nr:hypothetical protein [Nitrospinota bacterium]MBL7021389.1 hypothetical protein [Nitrospinaceae bacterium]